MSTMDDRVSRLEGAYEHLATKADVAELKAEMADMKAELIKWMAGWTLGGDGRNLYDNYHLDQVRRKLSNPRTVNSRELATQG